MNNTASAQDHRWLVVDDEPDLSTLISIALSGIAPSAVENTTSSPEAFARLMSQPGRFDLLVTDRDMPAMNGLELASRVHAEMPRTKILLVSANVDDLTPADLDRIGIAGVVQKPFTLAQLEAAAQRVMG